MILKKYNQIMKYLHYMNVFSRYFYLNFNGKEKNDSIIGLILSFITYAAGIAILAMNISDLIQGNQATINFISKEGASGPNMTVNNEDNFIFVNLMDKNSKPLNDSIANLSVFYTIMSQGVLIDQLLLPTVSCSESAIYQQLNITGYETARCIDTNTKIVLGGIYTSEYYGRISINLSRCVNGSNTNTICEDDASINEVLTDAWFEFYFINKNVDVNNYTSPFSPFLDSTYVVIDPVFHKQMYVYFNRLNIFSNNNYFFNNKEELSANKYQKTIQDQNYAPTVNKVVSLTLYSSRTVESYNRYYLKVQDVAAKVSGLVKVITLMCSFITEVCDRFIIKYKMANLFFEFSDGDTESQKISRFKKSESANTNNKLVNPVKIVHLDNLNMNFNKSFNISKKNGNSLANFKKFTGKKNKDIISLKELVFYSLCYCINRKEKQKIDLIEKHLLHYTDFVSIINSVKDLNYFKEILFEDQQLVLLKKMKKIKISEDKFSHHKDEDDEATITALNYCNANPSRVNRKLLEFFM